MCAFVLPPHAQHLLYLGLPPHAQHFLYLWLPPHTQHLFYLWLPPRSLLIMRGAARYEWTHGIPGRKVSVPFGSMKV